MNPSNKSLGRLEHWRGRSIYDFLENVSATKLTNHLEALKKKPEKPLSGVELNHVDNANWEFPVRYTLLSTGAEGDVILLGQDLRPIAEVQQQLVSAQLALEQDYEKQRDFETRFRVLLDRSRDAFAIIDANGLVLNLNSAASELLQSDESRLVGNPLSEAFEERGRDNLVDKIMQSAASDSEIALSVRAKNKKREIKLHPTMFRSGGEVTILCRLDPNDTAKPAAQALREALHDLYVQSCEGIVFTDAAGTILQVNKEFLTFCDLPRVADAKGKSFSEFLARGGVDLKVLLEHANRSGRLRLYATKLKSPFGALAPVEISAVNLSERRDLVNAFVIRGAARGEAVREVGASDDTMRNVMELVGSAPLKDLVAATADVVERMCIETAVELTRNNRVAAAELLGLSRQSLYVKLRKYGLLNKNADDQN